MKIATWTSQSGGYTKAKRGIVLGTIPAGDSPLELFPELKTATSSQIKLGYGKAGATKQDRYLVQVKRTHAKTGEQLKPLYYGPRVSQVEITEE